MCLAGHVEAWEGSGHASMMVVLLMTHTDNSRCSGRALHDYFTRLMVD